MQEIRDNRLTLAARSVVGRSSQLTLHSGEAGVRLGNAPCRAVPETPLTFPKSGNRFSEKKGRQQ